MRTIYEDFAILSFVANTMQISRLFSINMHTSHLILIVLFEFNSINMISGNHT